MNRVMQFFFMALAFSTPVLWARCDAAEESSGSRHNPAISLAASGQCDAASSTTPGDPVRPLLAQTLAKMGDVGSTSRLWGIPSQPLAALPEAGVGPSQQPQASSDPGGGHLAYWDHLAFAAALGAVVGRAVGYCEGESFDVGPVFGHVAVWSLLSMFMEEDNPYSTRHTSKQAADRLWDTPLISAGFGALWGAIGDGCHEHENQIPREQIVITGAVVLGATGLVLDILHKNDDGEDPSTVSLRVSPNLQPSGVGVSISARF